MSGTQKRTIILTPTHINPAKKQVPSNRSPLPASINCARTWEAQRPTSRAEGAGLKPLNVMGSGSGF